MIYIFSFPLIPGTVPGTSWNACAIPNVAGNLPARLYSPLLRVPKICYYATFAPVLLLRARAPSGATLAPPSPQVPQKIERAMPTPPFLVQRGCLFLAAPLRMHLHEHAQGHAAVYATLLVTVYVRT